MQRTIVQVPMSNDLRKKAEMVSADMGFSSLQETIRVLLTKLSKQELTITIREMVSLSPEAEQRYAKVVEDITAGQNVYKPKNKQEFFKMLRS
ncbi:MAG: hypothetical protein O3B47_04765 [bacterium]|nr:hypothetical protein [bacterium]